VKTGKAAFSPFMKSSKNRFFYKKLYFEKWATQRHRFESRHNANLAGFEKLSEIQKL
jgi:hypothetical protein